MIANSGIKRTDGLFPLLLMHTVLGATASSRPHEPARGEGLHLRRVYEPGRATRSRYIPRDGGKKCGYGASIKVFPELERIRTEPVSEKEIADAKSYLTGVFPLRLETQEGLIDQLVQIKMLDLPDDHLETYRDRVQAVTIEQIQSVAQRYVRPDEAAMVIVGDGAEIVEQIKPYCEDIRIFNTAVIKELPVPGATMRIRTLWRHLGIGDSDTIWPGHPGHSHLDRRSGRLHGQDRIRNGSR